MEIQNRGGCGVSKMVPVPWIISESLPDALAQIADLRTRIKKAATYDGTPLTPKMRTAFQAMLDGIESEEITNAREQEDKRIKHANQLLKGAIKHRSAGLTEIATAVDWLSDGISRVLKSDAVALNAARELGVDAPDITAELQQLVQRVANAVTPLDAIIKKTWLGHNVRALLTCDPI